MNKITIFIADDHPICLKGLRLVIETDSRLKLIGESTNGEEALSMIAKLKPDIAVLDLSMPGKRGDEIIQLLNKTEIKTGFIVLTMHDEEETLNSILDLGVKGYVLKDSAITEIVEAILTVKSGQNYITPRISSFLVSRIHEAKKMSYTIEDLTLSERKVLKLIAEYKTTKEIARELFISHRTVDRHRNNICHKLGITGVNSLLKFATQNQKVLSNLNI